MLSLVNLKFDYQYNVSNYQATLANIEQVGFLQ